MKFNNALQKVKGYALKAKEKTIEAKNSVVELVTEEVPVDESSSKTKKVPAKWLVETGKYAALLATMYYAIKNQNNKENNPEIDTYRRHNNLALNYQRQNEVKGSSNFDDTSLENLLSMSSRIENLLKKKGAIGRGLHEKVTNIENKLPCDTVKAIRMIATLRNKMVHEGPNSINSSSKKAYLKTCKTILKDIEC